MKNLVDVYEDISKANISINNYNFTNDRKAVILKNKDDENHFIYIDDNKITTSTEEKCILAEEYAHYKTGTLYSANSKFETISRLENRARKYQTKYLIPKKELMQAIYDGNYYYYELAEKFQVSEEIIKKALEIYNIEYEIGLSEV